MNSFDHFWDLYACILTLIGLTSPIVVPKDIFALHPSESAIAAVVSVG